jgi:hypothetical protein
MTHWMMKLLRTLLPCVEAAADPDAAYLDQAVDIADLERRMRAVQVRT